MDDSLTAAVALAVAPAVATTEIPSPLPPPRQLEYAGPFAPPIAARLGAWREGRLLVLFDGSALPARCIKCGRPGPIHVVVLRLAWLPPHLRWLAAFVFIALGFARRTRMEVALCDQCHFRRQSCFRRAGLLLVIGLALLLATLRHPTQVVAASGGFAMLGAALLLRRARPVTVRRLAFGVVHASGAAPAFLAALPIGGPPGIGITSNDLADRLTHVGDRRRRKRCRRRIRHRRKSSATE